MAGVCGIIISGPSPALLFPTVDDLVMLEPDRRPFTVQHFVDSMDNLKKVDSDMIKKTIIVIYEIGAFVTRAGEKCCHRKVHA